MALFASVSWLLSESVKKSSASHFSPVRLRLLWMLAAAKWCFTFCLLLHTTALLIFLPSLSHAILLQSQLFQTLSHFCVSYPISERARDCHEQHATMCKLKTSRFHVSLESSAVLKVCSMILYFGNLLNLNYDTYFLNWMSPVSPFSPNILTVSLPVNVANQPVPARLEGHLVVIGWNIDS